MGWFWLGIIIAAVAIDIFTSNLLFVWFAAGALGGLVLYIFDTSITLQFIIFAIISIMCTVIFYPKIKKKIKTENVVTKTMEENYIGRIVVLDRTIEDKGLMMFEGINWTFKTVSGKISEGEKAKIIAIEGNKLIIEKV